MPFGVQGLDGNGDITPLYSVIFGDIADDALCALDQRQTSSSRADAVLRPGAVDATVVGNIEGSYVQDPGSLLTLRPDSGVWSIAGTASLNGSLDVISNQPLPSRGERSTRPLLTANPISGQFDELLINGRVIPAFSHAGSGVFYTLNYTETLLSLETYNALPGDADGNGTVAFADFLILSTNFGNPGEWMQGDFDASRDVGFADFLLQSANFGKTASGADSLVASVPEPSFTWALAFVTVLWGRRIRKRS